MRNIWPKATPWWCLASPASSPPGPPSQRLRFVACAMCPAWENETTVADSRYGLDFNVEGWDDASKGSLVPGKDKKYLCAGGRRGGICAQSRLLILFHTDAKYRSFQTTKKLFLDHPCNVSTLASDVISHFHFFVNSCFFLDRSQTFWKSCDKGLKSFFVPRVSQT